MKLLFDQNLSDRLLRTLAGEYPGSVHVRDVGLARADDEQVWRYALDQQLTITSKDSDFHQRNLVRGYPRRSSGFRPATARPNGSRSSFAATDLISRPSMPIPRRRS